MITDTDRLDWLTKNQRGIWISTTRVLKVTTEIVPKAYEEYRFDGWCVSDTDEPFASPRDAIDAVMLTENLDDELHST